MEQPFDDAAMLHFIRDSLFRTNSPLHHEFSILLEKFIAERIASGESEWFPCISRDHQSLTQKLADPQAKVIELEQRMDALQTTTANATAATDHRVDTLQSPTDNATQGAVSELRRLEHKLSQCYVLLNEFTQVSSQQPSNHFQFRQQQPQPQPSPSSYPPYSTPNSSPYPPQQPTPQPPVNPMHQVNPVNVAIQRAPTLEILGRRVERLNKLIGRFSGRPGSGELRTWNEDCIPYRVLIWTLGEQLADLPHAEAMAQIQIRHTSLRLNVCTSEIVKILHVQTMVKYPEMQTEISIFQERKILYFCTRATRPKLQDRDLAAGSPQLGITRHAPRQALAAAPRPPARADTQPRGMHSHLCTEKCLQN